MQVLVVLFSQNPSQHLRILVSGAHTPQTVSTYWILHAQQRPDLRQVRQFWILLKQVAKMKIWIWLQPLLSKTMVTTVPLNKVTVVGTEEFVPLVVLVVLTVVVVGFYTVLNVQVLLVRTQGKLQAVQLAAPAVQAKQLGILLEQGMQTVFSKQYPLSHTVHATLVKQVKQPLQIQLQDLQRTLAPLFTRQQSATQVLQNYRLVQVVHLQEQLVQVSPPSMLNWLLLHTWACRIEINASTITS